MQWAMPLFLGEHANGNASEVQLCAQALLPLEKRKKNCLEAGTTAQVGYGLGVPLWCIPREQIQMSLHQHFSYAPLQKGSYQLYSPQHLQGSGHKNLSKGPTACAPDTYPQHWATAVVCTSEADRPGRRVLFQHLNNNRTFSPPPTLAFDIEALHTVAKSWCHYDTWICSAWPILG